MKSRIVLITLTFIFGLQTSWANQQAPVTQNGLEPVVAHNYLNAPAADAEYTKMMKTEKKGLGNIVKWIKEKLTKAAKKLAQLGGLDDPVDKWFWYWILGWGVAILIGIVGAFTTLNVYAGFSILGTLSYLAWVFGTIALVIWIIKQIE